MVVLKSLIFWSFLVFTGCSTSEYNSERSAVDIAMEISTDNCYNGKEFKAGLEIQGSDDSYYLCATIQAGDAQIQIDNTSLPLTGEWIKLSSRKVQLTILPEKEGELLLTFQARSVSTGILSKQVILRRMVQAGAAITPQITYDCRVVNPGLEARIPLHFSISKPGYKGKYTVTMSLSTGDGVLYYNGYIVNGTTFYVGNDAVVYYQPKVLGDHLLDFVFTAAGETAKATAYFDVSNNIVANHEAPCGVKISGIGEYSEQGKEVVLKLINDSGFNYVADGWYDKQGNLLCAEAEYKQKMAVGNATDVMLKLKHREVRIIKHGDSGEDVEYYDLEGGKLVKKYCGHYISSISADYCLSDTLVFYYQRGRYVTPPVPPAARFHYIDMDFLPGQNWLGYFYKIDGDFMIYLRKEDNPSLVFNSYNRYVEKGLTRYYIGHPIIILE